MFNTNVIAQIQGAKLHEAQEEELPVLDTETREIMKAKRVAIDEPPTPIKADPLR